MQSVKPFAPDEAIQNFSLGLGVLKEVITLLDDSINDGVQSEVGAIIHAQALVLKDRLSAHIEALPAPLEPLDELWRTQGMARGLGVIAKDLTPARCDALTLEREWATITTKIPLVVCLVSDAIDAIRYAPMDRESPRL